MHLRSPLSWKKISPPVFIKRAKRTDISAKHNLAQGEHAYSRPGPSNSCCVLFSPGKCLPRVGDRGHGRRMVGLMRKQKPQAHTMTTNTIIIIIIIITSSSARPPTPIVCNHGDSQSERAPLALEVGAVSGSAQWPSNCLSAPLRKTTLQQGFHKTVSLSSNTLNVVGIFPLCLSHV